MPHTLLTVIRVSYVVYIGATIVWLGIRFPEDRALKQTKTSRSNR
jgi:hypothetical protein